MPTMLEKFCAYDEWNKTQARLHHLRRVKNWFGQKGYPHDKGRNNPWEDYGCPNLQSLEKKIKEYEDEIKELEDIING